MSEMTNPPSLMLVCISGPDAGKRVAVKPQPVTIGKSSACEIASDDADVLERHVALQVRDGKVFFKVAEAGAVFLDGQRESEGELAAKEQLRVGRSLWQLDGGKSAGDFTSMLGDFGDKISEVAGVEKIEGFSAAAMFSEVFRKRTDEEMETYFAVGAPTTTPKLAEVDAGWPRPWLFVKVFGLAALAYIGLLFAYQTFNNSLMIPGLLTVGGFMIPFSLLIFFFEVNVLRNVPLYQILKLLFLGGILSVIAALFLLTWTKPGESWLGAVVIGVMEEAGKVAALLLVVGKLKYRWTLNGMLFGAAVGAGFAGFESAGYALNYGLDNITTRGLLCICGGHVLWCALTGAALWRVRGEKPFEWAMLQDIRFLRVFGLAAAMHAIWDAPFSLPLDLKYIALGFVVWVAVLSYIQTGLRQVREAQAAGATEFFRKQE
ncbi:MAG: PrsW family glutamic-type intramembrane protease [Verrucomicrobia bacterium]|nr:PrsW family glutamic-type intramembrane protease [Verrucomicrobiota bacterium]